MKQTLKATISSNVPALRGSFLVSNYITKIKKSFTVGKKPIFPAAKDIYHELSVQASVEMMVHVPYLVRTMTRWVDMVAEDMVVPLSESPWYAIQVEGSTDDEAATGRCAWGYIM